MLYKTAVIIIIIIIINNSSVKQAIVLPTNGTLPSFSRNFLPVSSALIWWHLKALSQSPTTRLDHPDITPTSVVISKSHGNEIPQGVKNNNNNNKKNNNSNNNNNKINNNNYNNNNNSLGRTSPSLSV